VRFAVPDWPDLPAPSVSPARGLDPNQYRPGQALEFPGDCPQCRRFARPVWANQSDDLACFHGKSQALDYLVSSALHRKVRYLENFFSGRLKSGNAS